MPPTYTGPAEITIAIERGEPASLIRVSTDVPSEQRAGHIGPLERWREPLEELRVYAATRAALAGAVPVGQVESWRLLMQSPTGEVEDVREALERLLHDDDPSLIRAYLRRPLGGYRDVIQWSGSPDLAARTRT